MKEEEVIEQFRAGNISMYTAAKCLDLKLNKFIDLYLPDSDSNYNDISCSNCSHYNGGACFLKCKRRGDFASDLFQYL